MTPRSGSLEFASARVAARRGMRPSEAAWQRLESLRELPALLEAVRETNLAPWTLGISAESDLHAIERALRAGWRAETREVTHWMAAPWQDALAWWTTWIDLPVIEHLAGGGPVLPWMRHDAVYGALLEAPARPACGTLAALREMAAGDPATLLDRWCSRWHRWLPGGEKGESLLRETERAVTAHRAALRSPALRSSGVLRSALAARLQRLFRRATLDPAAIFLHVALDMVDFERLRGEFVRRVAFPYDSARSAT